MDSLFDPPQRCPQFADGEAPSSNSAQRRRKRPRVPEGQRQRAALACTSCRRLKERCDGGTPCTRCVRNGRACERSPSDARINAVEKATQCKYPRLLNLEYIVRHYLGEAVLLSDIALQTAVDAIKAERNPEYHCERSDERQSHDERELAGDEVVDTTKTVSRNQAYRLHNVQELAVMGADYTIKAVTPNAAHYSGEFSHWSFSKSVRENVDRRLQESAAVVPGYENDVVEYWRASHLRSSRGTLQFIIEDLPPKDIAVFLTKTYFSHAQTNTVFAEESWVVERVHRLYMAQPSVCEEDAPWVCTTLLVLAVGTQFAHLESGPLALQSLSLDEDHREQAVESVGVSLYQKATRLIPDVLTIASVESVRAFLLLAHYALPLDAQGLAYSYLGIAMKVAIQNGMHRKCKDVNFDPSALSVRLHLWKTVYSLERRISILHGRPVSISCAEVDAECLKTVSPTSVFGGQHAVMLQLTDHLSTISLAIRAAYRNPGLGRTQLSEELLQSQKRHLEWWSSVPEVSSLPAFPSRAMVHLHLCYHLNLVFAGRPFVFTRVKPDAAPAHDGPYTLYNSTLRTTSRSSALASKAVESAQQIIRLCQTLQDSLGLARASYTEFSTCRAAVLTLLARSTEAFTIVNEEGEMRQSLAQGINLICLMASANASTRSEASVLVSLDTAIKRFSERRGANDNQGTAGKVGGELKPYDNFTYWALGLKDASCIVQDINWTQSPHESLPHDLATVDLSEEWPYLWEGDNNSLPSIDELYNSAIQ